MAVGGNGSGRLASTGKAGSRAIQAGLLSMALVGTTLATVGPLFYAPAAYLLLTAAGVVAVLSFYWADRVAHASHPIDRVEKKDARIGQALSALTLTFVFWSTGLWYVFLALLPAVIVFGFLAWAVHRARIVSSGPPQEART